MKLYSEASSPYSALVRAAIYAKGLDIPIEAPPGGVKSDAYRALSRTGQVPCLILDDGSPLPESAVIIDYLDDKFPDRPLKPAGAEARARVALIRRLAEQELIVPMVELFHQLQAATSRQPRRTPLRTSNAASTSSAATWPPTASSPAPS